MLDEMQLSRHFDALKDSGLSINEFRLGAIRLWENIPKNNPNANADEFEKTMFEDSVNEAPPGTDLYIWESRTFRGDCAIYSLDGRIYYIRTHGSS